VNVKSRRNLIIAGIALLLLFASFMNPDQSSHLKAIKETVALRKPDRATDISNILMPVVHYNNYFVFSTTTFGTSGATLTYGYFGQVQTTDGIGILFGISN
jgi:hypothetical protein